MFRTAASTHTTSSCAARLKAPATHERTGRVSLAVVAARWGCVWRAIRAEGRPAGPSTTVPVCFQLPAAGPSLTRTRLHVFLV